MQGFTTTVQLPGELNDAIIDAVKSSFAMAKDQFTNENQFPLYLNKKQACQYLNVSYGTLMKWVKSEPSFPCSDVDGVVRFNRNELDKFMASKQNK